MFLSRPPAHMSFSVPAPTAVSNLPRISQQSREHCIQSAFSSEIQYNNGNANANTTTTDKKEHIRQAITAGLIGTIHQRRRFAWMSYYFPVPRHCHTTGHPMALCGQPTLQYHQRSPQMSATPAVEAVSPITLMQATRSLVLMPMLILGRSSTQFRLVPV